MNMWNEAFDEMNAIDWKNEELTVDQKLKLAEVKALLSISQELSLIQDQGINPKFSTRDS